MKISNLYSKWPYRTEELKSKAMEILQKEDVVNEIVAKVEAQIKVNEGKDKKPVLPPDTGSTLSPAPAPTK